MLAHILIRVLAYLMINRELRSSFEIRIKQETIAMKSLKTKGKKNMPKATGADLTKNPAFQKVHCHCKRATQPPLTNQSTVTKPQLSHEYDIRSAIDNIIIRDAMVSWVGHGRNNGDGRSIRSTTQEHPTKHKVDKPEDSKVITITKEVLWGERDGSL